MKQVRVLLTDEQYAFVHGKRRLWLRDVVQFVIDHPSVDPDYQPEPEPKPPWWKVWM